ncbi:709e0296-46c9-4b88-8e96-0c77b13a4457 [Thermothielavioides terrestris]|uniref:709e0296-46c9-4b88-8e96-0c77b13a4457 n=1 Tax=Thermothielavioides terrestris TaxID=2587410 RepID=A0A3S4BQ49_9PEZI|nr:709e0296-46c9-4b88-8e96-0c77b13a4457 [Thermothielavioides terrestris]
MVVIYPFTPDEAESQSKQPWERHSGNELGICQAADRVVPSLSGLLRQAIEHDDRFAATQALFRGAGIVRMPHCSRLRNDDPQARSRLSYAVSPAKRSVTGLPRPGCTPASAQPSSSSPKLSLIFFAFFFGLLFAIAAPESSPSWAAAAARADPAALVAVPPLSPCVPASSSSSSAPTPTTRPTFLFLRESPTPVSFSLGGGGAVTVSAAAAAASGAALLFGACSTTTSPAAAGPAGSSSSSSACRFWTRPSAPTAMSSVLPCSSTTSGASSASALPDRGLAGRRRAARIGSGPSGSVSDACWPRSRARNGGRFAVYCRFLAVILGLRDMVGPGRRSLAWTVGRRRLLAGCVVVAPARRRWTV